MLTLNRLPRRQGAEMIAYVTGGKALPKDISDQIVDRTDGVPLFIEELTKTVVESGIVTEAGDHYAVAGPMAPLAIPKSLHASLLARLDRLAPTREVAQIGAALGRSFSYELISAVVETPRRNQLDEALDQLSSAELVLRRGTPPDAEYTFKHALVQEAAYSTLLRSRRQQLHGHIATTMEEQFPEIMEMQPEVLARHCADAGLVEKAIRYWLKAGQRAIARSVMTEAVAQLRKGLDLLTNLPDDRFRQQQELDLRVALGPALIATKGYSAADVGDTIARARALAEQLDRADYLVPLLYGQWAYHLVRSEHRLALPLAEKVEKIGEAHSNQGVLQLGCYLHAIILFFLAEFAAARTLFERCHSLDEPAHRALYAPITAEDPHVIMLAYLALTFTFLGYVEQGRRRKIEACTAARGLGHLYSLSFALILASLTEWVANSPGEVQQHANESAALAEEHDFSLLLGYASIYRGWSMAAFGQAQEGLALLTNGFSMIRATGATIAEPWALTMSADAYGKLGQPEESRDCLAKALQIIGSTDERYSEAEVYRLRAELLNTAGDRAGAEQSYHQALDVAKRQSAKIFELRAATSLARLWCDQGKRIEARDLLAPVYNWFTEGFDTPVLQDAKALLDELA
jgi:predicted ATPase